MVTEKDRELIARISEVVCEKFGIQLADINKKCKKGNLPIARQTIWHLIRELTGMKISLQEIGNEVGFKSHCNVLFGINQINNLLETDKKYNSLYNEIYRIVVIPDATNYFLVFFSNNTNKLVETTEPFIQRSNFLINITNIIQLTKEQAECWIK